MAGAVFDLVVVAAVAVLSDALREAGGRFLGLVRHGLRERRADGGRRAADAVSVEGTDGANSPRIHAGLVPIGVHALGGDDDVTTDAGDDTVDGGDGTDAADTVGGHDTYVSVEQPSNCESVTP